MIVLADDGDPLPLEPTREIAFTSSEGTWMSLDVSPDGTTLIFDLLGDIYTMPISGGAATRITKGDGHNALGATYSADGRYLYYALRQGGFEYDARFPMWQIARKDVREGNEDVLTSDLGSGIRPTLSPNGRYLVYGSRHHGDTGLKLLDLKTGENTWLVYPVTHDEQESTFTRDLLPRFDFTPDGESLIYSNDGGFERLDLTTETRVKIGLTAEIEQSLTPLLYFPWQLEDGDVVVRIAQDPAMSPAGTHIAFTALNRIYIHDLESGATKPISPAGRSAFQPAWPPDGARIAYVDWSPRGGHLWTLRVRGGRSTQVSRLPAHYSDPVFSPDGQRIVAVRQSAHDRLSVDWDTGFAYEGDLVWFPARGGDAAIITPARSLTLPHFGPDHTRIFLYQQDLP
ncbi:MAG: hypothetical protein OXE81_06970 [Gammaproteobacteria bacterium]|nr:hypothetical protein [Gammaproteobacteria bacterium]